MGYSLFNRGGANYLTVSELKSKAELIDDHHIMVEGKVAPGSIDWDGEAKVMRFALTDDRESLNVVYEGIMPDNFKPGADLVVVGKYGPDGVFEALSVGRGDSFCNACH